MTCDQWTPKNRHERGPDDSSSRFGQFIHSHITSAFNVMDDDRVVFAGSLKTHARSTGVLRHLEHMPRGGSLSNGETEILPLLAACFYYGGIYKILKPGSGVFLVESDPPYQSGIVRELRWTPDGGTELSERTELSGQDWARFLGADSAGALLKPARRSA